MILRLRSDADPHERQRLVTVLRDYGLEVTVLTDGGVPVIGINGRGLPEAFADDLARLPIVEAVVASGKAYRLAARAVRPEGTVVQVGSVRIGGRDPVVIAGPCTVESREQLIRTAEAVREAGATLLRGGAFKPRTSPYSFQGLGERGLELLAEARERTGLPIVTEVLDTEHVELVAQYADVLQIGSRNMMNFALLRKVAATGKPVLLKRGFAATVEEWLLAAEYLLAGGNDQVVLCERGVRGFDPATRFMLDLNAVPLVRQLSHLPVIVDPSHGTGLRELVPAMSLAAIAAGAHGLIVEVHIEPEAALVDGRQSIDPTTLADVVRRIRSVRDAIEEPVTV
ncbi:3-deoxy-7-phosphoheptulonate synthase [Thermomicrobium sp. 4228-Ro]|uniref:3-deoxy-7-phosphoheptulonate synthase n=1 Tax=Thermomicrobium sp. 4228-Ro TaxID=2993937 RepID=UPI0022489780|nr:3-deoxy-7-phosphoheptulonate synthase [Thermomicrobium sp. 4228-Ro]MCX2726418.1 3-deoxy-7-phosphoheptulonate synthase [Thermomicrobium sp. 4228-Ro]